MSLRTMAMRCISALRSRIDYLCMRMSDALTRLCPRLFSSPRHESLFEQLVDDVEDTQFSGESRGDDPPPPLHQDYDTLTFSPRPLPRYLQFVTKKEQLINFPAFLGTRGALT